MATATPFQIVSSSVLSTDFLASNQVLVDTTGATPVSVFRNPLKNGAIEALVITSALGTDSQLGYLCQDTSVATGWQVVALPTYPGWPAATAAEAVAFATAWNTVDAFFIGLDGNLYHIELDGGVWSTPQLIDDAPVGMRQLGVAYADGSTPIVVTAITADGNLFYAYSSDGDWSNAATTGSTYASVDSVALLPSEVGMLVWYLQNGSLWFESLVTIAPLVTQTSVSSDGPLLGVAWTDQGQSLVFLGSSTGLAWASTVLVSDYASRTSDPTYPWAFPTGELAFPAAIRSGTVVQLTNGLANLYLVDADDNVWFLPVTGWTTQTIFDTEYSAPVFGTPLLLHLGIDTIHADPMPADTPALLGVDSSEGALHLNFQDPTTSYWRTGSIVLPSTEQYSVARWRTEIAVFDANGQPVPNYPLTIAASSAVDLAVGGQFAYVDSTTTTTVTTNALGKATIATLATGLTTAQLTVTAADISDGVTIAPHQAINDYMAGTGVLPGLPALSASVLQQASVDGQPLAPALQGTTPTVDPTTAASYLNAIAKAPGSTSHALQASVGGARYLVLTRADPAGATYHAFTTEEEVEAHHARVRAALGSSFWSDVWHWAGDLWEGVKHAVITVYHAGVDLVGKTLKLIVKIGDAFYELADWAVDTVDGALHGIEAVFNYIGAEVDKVVDWLKAIFDFSAIWNTKTALESGIAGYLTGMQNGVDAFSNYFVGATNPIANLKTILDDRFQQAEQKFGGAFSSLSGWQTTGQPPSQTPGGNGAPAPATYSNDVHANWFQDQMTTNAPAQIDSGSGLTDRTPWDNLVKALDNVGDDLKNAYKAFTDAFHALFTVTDLSTLGDILIVDFLRAINALLDALLDVLDSLIQGVLGLADVVIGVLQTFLTTEISIGFLNTLYGWIAKLAGVSDPPPLTLAGLFSLLVAFPATIVFKLAVGDDQEPFPGGQLPGAGGTVVAAQGAGVQGAPTTAWLAWSSQLLGAIVTAVGIVPAILTDVDDSLSWASTWSLVGGIVAAVASMAPTVLPEAIDWANALSNGGVELVAAIGTALIMLGVMLQGLIAAAISWFKSEEGKDPLKILFTMLGVVMLGYKLYSVVENYDQLDDLEIAADFMSPWGNIMSIAGLSWVKDSELYPFALVLQLVGDFVSSLGSGGASIDDLLTTQPT